MQQHQKIDLSGRVAIVTGAGGGLGRSHALLLARRGARVVVNDLGSAPDGTGVSHSVARAVVEEIEAFGGEAIANGASVTDTEQVSAMVSDTLDRWGRVDILVNNAGILRDKTFAKMTVEEFRQVVDVHLIGAVICTKAVWQPMTESRYGSIVMTTSSSGLYGNFGQSNYGAAKLALVGLMQTLGLEGERYGIRVNCLAPTAATRMMEGILPSKKLAMLAPELVSPALLALVAEQAPNRAILCAGAGGVERAHITLTEGISFGDLDDAPEKTLSQLDAISNRKGAIVPHEGFDQAALELAKAGYREAALLRQ